MNARLQQLKAEAAAWEKANRGWDKGIGTAPTGQPYITPGGADSEPYDLRRAVSEPHVGKDGLPVLGERQPDGTRAPAKIRERGVTFSVFDGVAPAPLMTDDDLEERMREDGHQDAITAHAEAIRARALREYDGDYPDVLELLLQRKSLAEIAAATGYSERHVHNVVRGNAQRPEAECLNDWLKAFVRSVWQGDVPVSVEPVKTLKKSLQEQAVAAQFAWDFDALMAGVTA